MAIILDGTKGETFPSWTTAGRPATPSAGQQGFNTTLGTMEYYSGSSWVSSAATTSASNLTSGTLPAARLPTGSVLQVVQGTLGTSFSGTGVSGATNYWITVTGLSASITPSSTSSKILIMIQMYVGADAVNTGYQQEFQILRNGTVPSALIGTSEGGRIGVTGRINLYQASATYSMGVLSSTNLDSPASTSTQTYTIQLRGYSGSPTVYVNRQTTFGSSGIDYDGVPLSTITLMEIAG